MIPFLRLQEKNIKHTGSITLSDVIEIARVMRPRSCAANLAGTCKEILGTAVSVGCKVDGKHPSVIMDGVSARAPRTGRATTGHASTHIAQNDVAARSQWIAASGS